MWKIGRVDSRCFAVRKVCSTIHNYLQQSMASSGFEVAVVTQHKDAIEFLLLLDLSGSIVKCRSLIVFR